jgi:hypothetical protein
LKNEGFGFGIVFGFGGSFLLNLGALLKENSKSLSVIFFGLIFANCD